jgi:hypothetical protein
MSTKQSSCAKQEAEVNELTFDKALAQVVRAIVSAQEYALLCSTVDTAAASSGGVPRSPFPEPTRLAHRRSRLLDTVWRGAPPSQGSCWPAGS